MGTVSKFCEKESESEIIPAFPTGWCFYLILLQASSLRAGLQSTSVLGIALAKFWRFGEIYWWNVRAFYTNWICFLEDSFPLLCVLVTIVPVKTEYLSTKVSRSRGFIPSAVPGKERALPDYIPTDWVTEGVKVTAVLYLDALN